jgi:hypothetical protein
MHISTTLFVRAIASERGRGHPTEKSSDYNHYRRSETVPQAKHEDGGNMFLRNVSHFPKYVA